MDLIHSDKSFFEQKCEGQIQRVSEKNAQGFGMNPRGRVFSNAGTPVSMHVSSFIGTSPYQAAGRLATTLSFIINNKSKQKVRQTETKAKRTVNKTEKTLCRSHTGPVNSDQSLELSKRCLQTAEKSRTGRRGSPSSGRVGGGT